MSAEDFLSRHWQKTPLFMPGAIKQAVPELTADELAWLATLDDVESRLVFTEKTNGKTGYRLEHGPFDESELTELPPDNWTLLVHDVEKHLPVFRRLFNEVSFIPDWRIDDLMVSFAAPGGSVGPHRDNYDVFLCQGIGQRDWRVADAAAKLDSVEAEGLLLLEPFVGDGPIKATENDVLYLPPGIAHWGIATEASMTYSIGMRAPRLSDTVFYQDADLQIGEARPGLISPSALERARQYLDLDDQELAMTFGCAVTEIKEWLIPEAPSEEELGALRQSVNTEFRVHGMARLAYCSLGERHFVFVNGHGTPVTRAQRNFFGQVCANRTVRADGSDFVNELAARGSFDLQLDELPYAK